MERCFLRAFRPYGSTLTLASPFDSDVGADRIDPPDERLRLVVVFIETFNGSLRDECLNVNWFETLAEARRLILTALEETFNGCMPMDVDLQEARDVKAPINGLADLIIKKQEEA